MKRLKVTIVAVFALSVNISALAQESAPASVEAVTDGGVEVVRDAQSAAPSEPPKKVKDA